MRVTHVNSNGFVCSLFAADRNKLDIVQTDVIDDPTLQRSKNAICEKCNYNEAVFFQADEASSLIFSGRIYSTCAIPMRIADAALSTQSIRGIVFFLLSIVYLSADNINSKVIVLCTSIVCAA